MSNSPTHKARTFKFPLWLSIAGCVTVVGISSAIDSAKAQTSADPCRDPNANIELCPPQRLRPTFSEEESRGFEERGFSESFLGDALNGLSDPLGGGTVGGGQLEDEGFRELSPVVRGFIPAFDPTDVIIPIPAITDSDCCSD